YAARGGEERAKARDAPGPWREEQPQAHVCSGSRPRPPFVDKSPAMVRRDATERESPGGEPLEIARCASLAGASPAAESAGAPGSRPQATLERAWSQAGRQEPVRRREPSSGEQARGPQHHVKPAASTDSQSEAGAAHVTAKATPAKRAPERDVGLGGVGGAARVQREARNTRDPSQQPPSRQGGSYKPKAKSSAAERGSE